MTTSQKKDSHTEKKAKIQELREIITNAQETISSATQLLSAIQGTTRDEISNNHANNTEEEDGQVIYGYFDGQIMIGDDGKQYPVPANYASKSKLVEGDKLKLNITPDNKFIYKQIGPVQRNYLIGIVKQDSKGNFTIQTPEKEYQVLLAAATYFKIAPGDEVTLIIPQGKNTIWGAIENVLQKNNSTTSVPTINDKLASSETNFTKDLLSDSDAGNGNFLSNKKLDDTASSDQLTAIEKLELEMEKEKKLTPEKITSIPSQEEKKDDEWSSDIEKLKQEAGIATN